MRKSIVAKVLVYSLVSLTTWIVCSRIMAQITRESPRKLTKTSPAPTTVPMFTPGKSAMSAEAAIAFNNGTKFQRPIAECGLAYCTVETLGNQVMVKAGGKIYDSRPDVRYLWSMLVLSPQGKVVVPRHIYTDRPVPSFPGIDLTPELADSFALRPGDYILDISMHEINPHLPLNQQNFGEEGLTSFQEYELGRSATNQCFGTRKEVHID